jgi:hypothetical protein
LCNSVSCFMLTLNKHRIIGILTREMSFNSGQEFIFWMESHLDLNCDTVIFSLWWIINVSSLSFRFLLDKMKSMHIHKIDVIMRKEKVLPPCIMSDTYEALCAQGRWRLKNEQAKKSAKKQPKCPQSKDSSTNVWTHRDVGLVQ